jgi:23S rRNA (uracil1939-C5)-methyltransferase
VLLSIEKLIYGGDGLARTAAGPDGRSMAVFVPFVLPGERVEADLERRKGFSRASLTNVVEASSDRIESRCPYFLRCGGCHYQHIPYDLQLRFKAEILRETLQRIAKIELKSEIKLHRSPPWNYRNRTRLQIQTAPEFALGYFKFGSHEFLPVLECPISSPLLNKVMARMIELRGLSCPDAVAEIELFADAEDGHLLAWAFCRRDADPGILQRWAESIQQEIPEVSGVTFFASRQGFREGTGRQDSRNEVNNNEDELSDSKPLASCGAASISYQTANAAYRVSAGAFFQVNRHLIDDLTATVSGNATGDTALDLYAGVGLFSTALARNFHHIFGVEASLTSHRDFMHNVPTNVKAIAARTEDYLSRDHFPNELRRKRLDLIVLDPPRSGAGKKVISSIVGLGAPQIRYVSCDPATLARDLAPLIAAGYRIEEAHLFDMFPGTFHIESVMLLAR